MTQLTHPDLTVYKTWVLPDGKRVSAYQWKSGVDLPTFAVADDYAQRVNLPLMLWMHGSGGGNTKLTDASGSDGWVATRDGFLMAGGVTLEMYGSQTSINNGKQHWARVFARNGYSIPTQQLSTYLSVGGIWVVSTSMGTTLGKWLFTQDSYIAPKAVGYTDSAGLYDFMQEFDDGVSGNTADGVVKDRFDLAKYYGTVWPDRPSFFTATASTDPNRFTPSVWAGKAVQIILGLADVTAVPSKGGRKLWLRHGPGGTDPRFSAVSEYIEVPGAGHATASMYNDPRILAWGLARFGITPPAPITGNINVVEESFQLLADGMHEVESFVYNG
jgi:hypothetical protein